VQLQEFAMKTLRTLALAVAIGTGGNAFAGPVEVDFNSTTSQKGLGSFSGTAFYDNTAHTLTIDLTNTSAGKLTAFAFEVEPGDAAKYERPGKHAPWRDDRNHKEIVKAKPFGNYEAGAAVNGMWGSLAAKKGIAAGGSGVFVFDVTGANVGTLTTADFFTGTKPEIVASFAGFKHHKTDRAGGFGHVVVTTTTTTTIVNPIIIPDTPIFPGNPTGPVITVPIGPTVKPPVQGGPSAVPLPAAAPAGLAMLALIGLVGFARKFRNKFA
jgi:hypothetical protein